MENLNAEQVIKAMECCYDNNLSCIDCPFQASDKYVECAGLTISALSLIKELTEENERLSQSLANSKADTVRKMQERLHKRFKSDRDAIYTGYNIHRYIDQIAKEMLEGGNG